MTIGKEQNNFPEPIMGVIRIIGNRPHEYYFKNIMFQLIKPGPDKDTKVEQPP